MLDRLTLRLGDLSGPLITRCASLDQSPSEFCRQAIAKALGVNPPAMPQGFAAVSEAKRDKARRKSHRSRRRKARG